MLVWGSGNVRQMRKQNGHESTLGIDIQHAGKMYNDLNENGLLEIINQHQGKSSYYFHRWVVKVS